MMIADSCGFQSSFIASHLFRWRFSFDYLSSFISLDRGFLLSISLLLFIAYDMLAIADSCFVSCFLSFAACLLLLLPDLSRHRDFCKVSPIRHTLSSVIISARSTAAYLVALSTSLLAAAHFSQISCSFFLSRNFHTSVFRLVISDYSSFRSFLWLMAEVMHYGRLVSSSAFSRLRYCFSAAAAFDISALELFSKSSFRFSRLLVSVSRKRVLPRCHRFLAFQLRLSFSAHELVSKPAARSSLEVVSSRFSHRFEILRDTHWRARVLRPA